MQFGTNHLGHWAFTARLMPAILRADTPRVVTVTSTARHMARSVDPHDSHLHRNYSPWKAYGQSKLANFHFGIGLQREFERRGARASSHCPAGPLEHRSPGRQCRRDRRWVSQKFAQVLSQRAGMSPSRGALPQLRAATDPGARGGDFYRATLREQRRTRAASGAATVRPGRSHRRSLGREPAPETGCTRCRSMRSTRSDEITAGHRPPATR